MLPNFNLSITGAGGEAEYWISVALKLIAFSFDIVLKFVLLSFEKIKNGCLDGSFRRSLKWNSCTGAPDTTDWRTRVCPLG